MPLHPSILKIQNWIRLRLQVSILLLAGLLSFLVYKTLPFAEVTNAGIAIALLIGSMWLSEALPLHWSALLAPILGLCTATLSVRETVTTFIDPVLILFVGGFALATTFKVHKLDQYLTSKILRLAKGSSEKSLAYLFACCFFLSMWMSNMATAAVALPLAVGLAIKTQDLRTKAFIVLGVAHYSTLGGLATLIGSPPNAIAAANSDLNFDKWLFSVGPLAILLALATWFILKQTLKPQAFQVEAPREATPPLSRHQVGAIFIFVSTVLAWLLSPQLKSLFSYSGNMDALIAVFLTITLLATKSVTIVDLKSGIDWKVLLLFAGGLSLGKILENSQTSKLLANFIIELTAGLPQFAVLFVIIFFIVFLTELVSNTAAAALLIPLFQIYADKMGFARSDFSSLIAVAASCGFMLPVATPGNALAYATELITQKQMVNVGLRLNITAIILISAYFFMFMM